MEIKTTMSYYFTLVRKFTIKKSRRIHAGESVEKRKPSYTVGGNANEYIHYGEQYGDSLKTENRTAIRTSNPTAGHTH